LCQWRCGKQVTAIAGRDIAATYAVVAIVTTASATAGRQNSRQQTNQEKAGKNPFHARMIAKYKTGTNRSQAAVSSLLATRFQCFKNAQHTGITGVSRYGEIDLIHSDSQPDY
jgi:hypothetical protein